MASAWRWPLGCRPLTVSPHGSDYTRPRTSGSGPFYGWVVVGAVFVILMVVSGLGFYNASVILAAGTEELGVSVGTISGATALFFGSSGLTGFLLSRQMDALDLRYFFAAGGVLGAAALLALRWVDTVIEFYGFFAVFGVGFALAGLVPGTTLVTRWFDQRRSVALSIASTGLSVGGIALTPISVWLIDRRGLGGAGSTLAAMWIVGVIPVALLLVRSRPSDLGLTPDGIGVDQRRPTGTPQDSAARAGGLPEPSGTSFAEASRTRFFILLCVTYAIIFFSQVGALAHLFNLASERTTTATAGTALSLLAFTSVLGRLAGGVIVLRVAAKHLTMMLTVLQSVGLAALAFATTAESIIVASVLIGISVGNLLMLQPLLLAEAFGVSEYSRIYSFSQLVSTVGVAGGPFVLGVLHDISDYRTAFLVAALASLTAAVAVLAAGPVPTPSATSVGAGAPL